MKKILLSILTEVKGNVNANGSIAALTEIKKFHTSEGETKPYVSGRCVKFCIKKRLEEKHLDRSPLKRQKRVLTSKGNPILYFDDDLFGYMIAGANKRHAAIKTDGITALRHTEITRDFASRFDPTGGDYPSPFEVEIANFIGRNNWIIMDTIGKFEAGELLEGAVDESPVELTEIEENGKTFYYLPTEGTDGDAKYGRKNRAKAFFDILIKERYTFPRSATGLNQPKYFYMVIICTERLLPLFDSVDYETDGYKIILDTDKVENVAYLLEEGEKMFIVDFERSIDKDAFKDLNGRVEVVTLAKVNDVIEELVNYLVGD